MSVTFEEELAEFHPLFRVNFESTGEWRIERSEENLVEIMNRIGEGRYIPAFAWAREGEETASPCAFLPNLDDFQFTWSTDKIPCTPDETRVNRATQNYLRTRGLGMNRLGKVYKLKKREYFC